MQNSTPLLREPAPIPMPHTEYRYTYFRSSELAGPDWDAAAPASDLFFRREYLRVLENYPPQGMRFGYLVFYRGEEPVGVALCQIKYFKGDDNINELETPTKDPCFFSGLSKWFKRWVAGKMAADILICGNMLLTGEHGYWFDYQKITPDTAMQLLEEALNKVARSADSEGVKMPVILVKDLASTHRRQGQILKNKGYVEFDIQPNMVLHLPFLHFDEYMGAMSTKYRTRAKRAFKKGERIEKRELSNADIQRELPRMYALYKDIANTAGFNMVDLNEDYLAALKRDLPEQVRIFGYYLDGHLLAFFTTILNGAELEAHFLGYDKEHNHDLQLYLNILYDIVRIGIESGCHSIVFARTALEIKSSVGAVPHELYCYLRHQNPLVNKFTGTILDYLKPVEEWLPRHPFKHASDLDDHAAS
ncbi:MAG: GNAT family N-acetyltransferase [Saprospiraceae bacterium]|nr:GNAT family N-acetyltransferase [Saprospiraceae bacterium]